MAGLPATAQAQAPKIVWVSFHSSSEAPSAAAAGAGFTRAPDAGYTDLLEGAGANVVRYLTTGTPDPAAFADADLVIISRSVPSSHYQDANATAWNSIDKPIMVMGGYVIRNSRMGYTTGATIPDTASTISLNVSNPAHPIFTGVALDGANTMVNSFGHIITYNGLVQRGISVNTDPVAGDGVVLATVATEGDPAIGGMIIGEWQAGAVMGNATADTLAGHRLVFLSGSREQGITSEAAGIYDLDPAGEQLFFNAVNYMAGSDLVPPPKVADLLPADGSIFVNAAAGVTFTASSTVDIPTDGISLTVNGVDVSADLQFAGTPTSRQVSYLGLEANMVYSVTATVVNANGSRSASTSFDTFSESGNLVIEAEDFNFGAGSFFDTIVLCNDYGGVVNGCYFDRVSTPGIDAFDSQGHADDGADPAVLYRWGPTTDRDEEVDTTFSGDVVRSKYVGVPDGPNGPIRDYDVESVNAGDWQNYTRTLAQGTYNVYLRASTTAAQDIQLGIVNGSASGANQAVDTIGVFSLQPGGYQTVPLTDAATGSLKAFVAGGATTFRLTAPTGGGSLKYNFIMVVESADSTIPSSVAISSPVDGAKYWETKPVTVSAIASGPDGTASTITQVEFFANGETLGTVAAAPFEVTTSALVPGDYTLTAHATDSNGGVVSSDSVNITVRPVITEHRGNVVWVSFHGADDAPSANAAAAGFTMAPDVGYTELLWANGYSVTRYLTTGTPDPAAFADADVVIISRSVPSGNYQDAAATAWNSIDKPIIVMGGYVIRNSRMGYTTGATIPDTASTIRLRIADPTHRIFAGIAQDENNVMINPFAHIVDFNGTVQRGISVNTDPLAGDGVLLASIGTDDPANSGTGLIIGEWQAGAVMGNATADVLAGQRLVFLSGSREQGITSEAAGIYDLNNDGERLFLNAVGYMVDPNAVLSSVEISSPVAGAKYWETKPVTVTATALGPDGTAAGITKVEFFVDNQSIGTAVSEPFAVTTTALAAGERSLTAQATDIYGGVALSQAVSITVRPVVTEHQGNVVWVSFHGADDAPSANAVGAGFTMAPDVGYTDLLWAHGYSVTRYLSTGTPDPAALAGADVVIIGRSVPSGNYQDAAATAWNSIDKPVIVMGGYTIRSSRMGYTTGTTIPDTASTIRLRVADTSHPVFAGVTVDANDVMVNPFAHIVDFNGSAQRGISVNTDPLAGDGVLLASIGTDDPANSGTGMIIGEWQAGAVMGNAAADTLAGHRLVFLSGSREQGITSEGAGIFDLNDDGETLFINAVAYMAEAVTPPLAIDSVVSNGDGTLTMSWSGGGTLESTPSLESPDWAPVVGATSPYTVESLSGSAFYRVVQ
ncbi:MAG: hypothetical protein RI897_151 [Verrucomicrobiota bacterium]|jgi:ribosomal protein L31